MTRKQYAQQFYKNLKVMSRTANGILDISSSDAKADMLLLHDGEKIKNIIYTNMEKAIDFLYDNRNMTFEEPKEVADFLLTVASIANGGIVKEGHLFRRGAYSENYKYAKIKDLPEVWEWFTKFLYHQFHYPLFSVEELAAFCEYIINMVGHFFSDGCGKISMLVGMYVFMRHDRPCAEYKSREEYLHVVEFREIMDAEALTNTFPDKHACRFALYYKTLCQTGNPD